MRVREGERRLTDILKHCILSLISAMLSYFVLIVMHRHGFL